MNTGPFGSALHKTDYVQEGVPVINPADIHDGVVVAGKMVSPMTRDRLNSYVLRKGDLIIARRGEMGRAAFIGRSQDGWLCGTGCFFAHMPREMNGSFLKLLFSSLIIRKQLEESSVGTTLKNLNLTILGALLLPVPPLPEQRRIVAELDRCLSLVDTVERDGGELEALFRRLRSKVLDLAIRGELTERDPGDEPAGELLTCIREEKLAMVAREELKPKDVKNDTVIFTGSDGLRYEKRADGRGEPVCIEDEIPFEIPETWAWARLGTLATFSGGGTPEKGNPAYWGGEIPWASVKDIHGERLTATVNSITSEGLASKPSISICHPGQIIVATRLVPGKAIISGIECAINQDLKVVNTLLPVEYLSIWFKAHLAEFGHIGSGTTVPGIKLSDLESALVALPPLAEQQRIVEKTEAIFCQLR